MKECTQCHSVKPTGEFYRLTAQKSGLNPRCKVCVNENNRAYAAANSERSREWSRRRRLRSWAKKHLMLTDEQYEALLARADGRCEVCGREERTRSLNGHSFDLAIDHDHVTLVVRGMLCRQCNTALGCAQDDPALLRKLADYLENPFGLANPVDFEERIGNRSQADTFRQSKRPARGWQHATDTRKKIAAAHEGKSSPFKGVPRSPEVIEKIRQSQVGKKRSEEARANMRAARLRYLSSRQFT